MILISFNNSNLSYVNIFNPLGWYVLLLHRYFEICISLLLEVSHMIVSWFFIISRGGFVFYRYWYWFWRFDWANTLHIRAGANWPRVFFRFIQPLWIILIIFKLMLFWSGRMPYYIFMICTSKIISIINHILMILIRT